MQSRSRRSSRGRNPRHRSPATANRFLSALAESPAEEQGPLWFDAFWYAALEAAGIKDFRFHDLRHSAASYLAMSGTTTAEIAAVLGHKTLQMVKRYPHLSDQHTGAVVERMTENFSLG
ncbi:MAG: tyrosine-type recombinase/integrase [Burkholderiales bacterium]|nr:tyrosine-type recombinase/integrase [Burkholderiales bacterium]